MFLIFYFQNCINVLGSLHHLISYWNILVKKIFVSTKLTRIHSIFEGSGLGFFFSFLDKNAGRVAIKATPDICNIVVHVKMSFI